MNYRQILSNKFYWAIIAVVLIIGSYAYFGKNGGPSLDIAKAEHRTITQEVSATGNVKPAQSVDLAFEISGRIASISADVGDTVGAGQAIASLNSSELNAQLQKAQADLSSQQATLGKYQVDLNNYYGNAVNTVNGAYTNANDAIRIKIDSLFSDDESNSPKLTFDSNNAQEKINSEAQRLAVTGILNSWLSEINSLGSSPSQSVLEKALSDSKANLNSIYSFLNLLMQTTINAPSLSPATLVSYKTSINDARSGIDSAISSVTTLIQNISSQKALLVSKQADIKSYQASIENINAQLTKTSLRSPIYGVVTKQDAKVGEIAAANSVLVSVMSSGRFEIDSYIPEVDIARVKVGNAAKVTLDAYGNNVIFDARVASIDPGETEIEGVATYLTKFTFSKPDVRIKPGMTANIDIASAVHENVLSLPQRAIQKRDDKNYVLLYTPTKDKNASSTAEKDITIGIRGSDGYTEIISGLSEGDQVVIPALGK